MKSVNIVERGTHMPMHEVVEITYKEKGGKLYEGQRAHVAPVDFQGSLIFSIEFYLISMLTYWSCSINPNYD